MMRMGFIGPAEGDVALFERRLCALIDTLGAERVHYLGSDDVLEDAARKNSNALGVSQHQSFEAAVAALGLSASASEIQRFLRAGESLARLHECRAVPLPPTRTIEMIEDRLLVLVFDKGVLDEDDIANADVVVFGRADAPLARKFGPRLFFSPGAAASGYGLATLEESGLLTFAAFDDEGRLLVQESLAPRSARFSVSS